MAALLNPTSCLPRIKSEPSSIDLFHALGHVSLLYSPRSLNKEEAALFDKSSCHERLENLQLQDAIDAAKVDDHERRFAMDWITRLIGSGLYWLDDEAGVLSADALLDLAGRILGGHASLEESGAISRQFFASHSRFLYSFPSKMQELIRSPASSNVIEVILRDDPLPPSDTQSESSTNNGAGSSQDAAAAVGVQTWEHPSLSATFLFDVQASSTPVWLVRPISDSRSPSLEPAQGC